MMRKLSCCKEGEARQNSWALFAIAGALEREVVAQCEVARLRVQIERLRRINPIMVKNTTEARDA
jgi:hypothetical protein